MSRPAWLTLLALSCAASVAGVRLARPFALDDLPAAVLLLAVVPSAFILLISRLRRPVGVLVALLAPVFWLYIASRSGDPLWLWAVPLATGGLMIALVRSAQARSLPRAVPLAAAAIALAAFLLPAPGQPAAGARALLIGIEGATWERVDPVLASGRLPHLARSGQGSGRRAYVRPSARHHPCEVWHIVLDGAGPDAFVLAGSCAPEGRGYPAGMAFLASLDRATMPRSTTPRGAALAAERDQARGASVGALLDAARNGARLSTLRRVIAERITRSRQRGDPSPDQAARARAWFWDLAGDVCAERLRARGIQCAALLLTAGDAPQVSDELYDAFDRALGKLVRAAPASADIVIVSVPNTAAGGLLLMSGTGAERAFPAAWSATPAGVDTVDAPAVTAAAAAVLGLPPAPASPGAAIGSQ